MRRVFWEKDDFFPFGDGRIEMDPAVVSFMPEGKYPLTWNYGTETDALLGHATDIRLEDGEMSAELVWNETKNAQSAKDLLEHGDVRLGGYYSHIKKVKDGDVDRCTEGTLRAISVIIKNGGANPGAKV